MMSERDFFSSIPTQVALGNHDLDTVHRSEPIKVIGDSLEIGLAYENRFRMPQIRPPIRELASLKLFSRSGQPKDFLPYEYGNAYYSFTLGPSKHIVLSSYSSFRSGSLQYDWLLSELKSVDRSVTPWLIVMLHCPLYTTFQTHHKELFTTEAQAILEPLFVENTVNIVFAGHIHAYMRTHPMAFSRRDPRGPIHIIQGNGGRQANDRYKSDAAEEWVDVRDRSIFGYGTLELFNNTHAMWKWVKTGFNAEGDEDFHGLSFDADLNVHDMIWIRNQLYVEEMGVSEEIELNI